MPDNKLSVKAKLGFGICDLGGNMVFTVLGFWCMYYLTDVVGFGHIANGAALAGFALMIGKLWDAVTDPVMGFISDRTISRWGRRRPYLLFGALPTVFAMGFLFTSPNIQKPLLLTAWAAFALMLFNTVYTLVAIPYSSLTPELTDDYHERSSLNGYRFGCAVFGTIIGAAAVQPVVGLFGSQKAGFSFMGFLMGGIVAVVTLITFFATKEKSRTKADLPTGGFFSTYKVVFSNKPYVLLLNTYCLHLMGITFLQTILMYYTKYIYRQEGLTTPAMVILLVVAMIFIPVSVLVSKKIGKKLTYQICFVIISSACMIIFFAGHLLGPNFFLGMMVYAGIGVGFSYVAPFAMVPDAVEYDAVKTGERNEGAYYGMWTFIAKIGQSLSVFIAGQILSLGGYVAEAIQTPSAVFAIRIIIGPLPALILVAAIILIQFYPIDEKMYKEIMTKK